MQINTYHEVGLTDTHFGLDGPDADGKIFLTIAKTDHSQVGRSRIEHELEVMGTSEELAWFLSVRGGRHVKETIVGETRVQLTAKLREAILQAILQRLSTLEETRDAPSQS